MKKLLYFFRKFFGIIAVLDYVKQTNQIEKEILYAHKFNSTIVDSCWFKYKSVSPGDFAVDYRFFYTLYRVLNSIKPKSILEFGLGQSSKMVHQFSNYYQSFAVTVEHDSKWVDFFMNEKIGDYNVNIQLLELENTKYKGEHVVTYKNCYETFCNDKFDLVIVDGPFGYTSNTIYSRTQIIEIAKKCMNNYFVILLDDYNRKGEQNTVNELFEYFETHNIKYVYKVYSVIKSHILITVPKFQFLTTL